MLSGKRGRVPGRGGGEGEIRELRRREVGRGPSPPLPNRQMVVRLLLSWQLAKRKRETERKRSREMNLSSTFHLLLHPLTHFCCQPQLISPISILLRASFAQPDHQSFLSHPRLCRSSVTGYYFSLTLCLRLYVCIHLSFLNEFSFLVLWEEVRQPSLDSCNRGKEKDGEGEMENEGSYWTSRLLKVGGWLNLV